MKNALILAVVAIGGLLIWWLLRSNDAATPKPDDKEETNDDGTPRLPGLLACYEVPATFPRYSTGVVADDVLERISPGKVRMGGGSNEKFRAVVQGFFKAIDVEPSVYAINYFGSTVVNQYLASPEGSLPHDIVVQGSLRCTTT